MWRNSLCLILVLLFITKTLGEDYEEGINCNGRASYCVTKTSYSICNVEENGESYTFGPIFKCPPEFVCDSENSYGSCHPDASLNETSSTASTTTTESTTPAELSSSTVLNDPVGSSSTTTSSDFESSSSTTTSSEAPADSTDSIEPDTPDYPDSSIYSTDIPVDSTTVGLTDHDYIDDDPSINSNSSVTPNNPVIDNTTPTTPSIDEEACSSGPVTPSSQYALNLYLNLLDGVGVKAKVKLPIVNELPRWLLAFMSK